MSAPRRPLEAHIAGLRGPRKHIAAAADVLYRWSIHAHHYPQQPILLTDAEFAEALDAAGAYPASKLVDVAKGKA